MPQSNSRKGTQSKNDHFKSALCSLPPGQTPAAFRHRIRAVRRSARLRSRVASRIKISPRCDRTDGRFRRNHRANQDRLGRDQQLDSQRGFDRRDVFDARRSGAGSHDVRTGRLVGAACNQGRSQSSQTSSSDARDGRGREAITGDGESHLQRRVRKRRRHRDRHRARRSLTKECPYLHRRYRNEDDGALGRDSGRRAAELSRVAGLQPRSNGTPPRWS